MILVDLSQVMISSFFGAEQTRETSEIDENLIRHIVLNSLRSYKQKFGEDYGEVIICADSPSSWRKDVFPQYKASRKKARQTSHINWTMIFDSLNRVRDEIQQHLPYRVLHVIRAEADDIIATLCHRYGRFDRQTESEPILILSGDKDFVQLQKYVNVQQYSPVQKSFLPINNPARFLRLHIMSGDRGDGIPNFLSPDDTFVEGKRQKTLPSRKLDEWATMEPEKFCDADALQQYRRNEMLIDLDKIPKEIQDAILEQYDTVKVAPRQNILPYFMEHHLKSLTEQIGDF